jgi:diaminohydroxyphosphoribosylaminopyrimidine deaminase/5-amino-6-(5-phosphoribosylamino)uracil reductase
MKTDSDWMADAIVLGERGRGRTAPSPSVGCLIVKDRAACGSGWTQPGGRPHAEAMALAEAGEAAVGATAYVTLEPCAHESPRGPACADVLAASGVSRVVIGLIDPDPRTAGRGAERLRAAGVAVETGVQAAAAGDSLAGFLARHRLGRPFITVKLAMSLDGKIALPSGESRWITGGESREDVHRLRARSDMIVVGRGTYDADQPRLDVRLSGLEDRAPRRALLTRGPGVEGWVRLGDPQDVFDLHDVNDLLVEGGAGAASAFLAADLVDRLLIYRAPILIGEGKPSIGDIGLAALADAHGRWMPKESRMLGIDRLEVYERVRS